MTLRTVSSDTRALSDFKLHGASQTSTTGFLVGGDALGAWNLSLTVGIRAANPV